MEWEENNKRRRRSPQNQYESGDGYRARALVYSLECFFDAFVLSALH